MPLVTIIIAVYNSEKTIARCIESIQHSNGFSISDWEILAIYRESADKSQILLSKYPGIRIIEEKTPGIAAAHNRGVIEAKSPYIIFVNSDDTICPNFVTTLLHEAKMNPNDITFTDVQFIDEYDNVLYVRKSMRYFRTLHKYSSIVLHPNAIYPAKLMKGCLFSEADSRVPTDNQQIYEISKNCRVLPIHNVYYRFRIWPNSFTVKNKSRNTKNSLKFKILSFFARGYVQLHESRVISRGFNKLIFRKSLWK
jgi:glycosyltransferase involved in cell wall biosynthesis